MRYEEGGKQRQRDNTSRFALRSLKVQGTCSKQAIFKSYPCWELDRLSGACAIQIECTYPW